MAKSALEYATEFVRAVDALNTQWMRSSHDLGKECMARELLRLCKRDKAFVEAVKAFGKAVDENPVTRLREVAEYFIRFRRNIGKQPDVDDRMVADACWALGRLIDAIEGR